MNTYCFNEMEDGSSYEHEWFTMTMIRLAVFDDQPLLMYNWWPFTTNGN